MLRPVVALGRTGPRAASQPAPPSRACSLRRRVPARPETGGGGGRGGEGRGRSKPASQPASPPALRAAPPGLAGALTPSRPVPGPVQAPPYLRRPEHSRLATAADTRTSVHPRPACAPPLPPRHAACAPPPPPPPPLLGPEGSSLASILAAAAVPGGPSRRAGVGLRFRRGRSGVGERARRDGAALPAGVRQGHPSRPKAPAGRPPPPPPSPVARGNRGSRRDGGGGAWREGRVQGSRPEQRLG